MLARAWEGISRSKAFRPWLEMRVSLVPAGQTRPRHRFREAGTIDCIARPSEGPRSNSATRVRILPGMSREMSRDLSRDFTHFRSFRVGSRVWLSRPTSPRVPSRHHPTGLKIRSPLIGYLAKCRCSKQLAAMLESTSPDVAGQVAGRGVRMRPGSSVGRAVD